MNFNLKHVSLGVAMVVLLVFLVGFNFLKKEPPNTATTPTNIESGQLASPNALLTHDTEDLATSSPSAAATSPSEGNIEEKQVADSNTGVLNTEAVEQDILPMPTGQISESSEQNVETSPAAKVEEINEPLATTLTPEENEGTADTSTLIAEKASPVTTEEVLQEEEVVANQCVDGLDNDNDRKIDLEDEGCKDSDDLYEINQINENTFAAQLDAAVGQYFSTTNYSGLDATNSVTIEAWVNLESDGFGFPTFVLLTSAKIPNPLQPQYWLYKETLPATQASGGWLDKVFCLNTTIINIYGDEEDNEYCWRKQTDHPTKQLIDFDDWFHIAVVYDREIGQQRFYLNGNRVNLEPRPTKEEISQGEKGFFAIGGPALGAGNCNSAKCGLVDGMIDEVRVWNVPRTDSEILQNFEKQLSGDEPGLAGYWKFEENGNDSSPFGNHLTPNGNPEYLDEPPFE